MNEFELLQQNLGQELRRGVLVLAVLARLDEPKYGYSLLQDLQDQGLAIEQNTLYPLLRRLESQELLESNWNLEENRPRKYYQISSLGKEIKIQLIKDWKEMNQTLDKIIQDDQSNSKGGI
jgi:PadR family transcriptional regulator PadR